MRDDAVLDLSAVYRDARQRLLQYVRTKCYWAGDSAAEDITDEVFARLPEWTPELLAQQGYLRSIAKRVILQFVEGVELDGRSQRIKARSS